MKKVLGVLTVLAVLVGCTKVEQYHKGWPEKNPKNLKSGFVEPPKGYGNVPFYWWSADTLNLERLEEQLDILADASTDGLCVSYNHLCLYVDTLPEQKKHGMFGAMNWGVPRCMSEEWFDIWNRFSAKCADRGIGLGMDDYVIAWPGNSSYIDDVKESLGEYPGRLDRKFVHRDSVMPDNVISKKPSGDGFDVIYAKSSVELHPDFGKNLVAAYLDKFQSHMDKAGRRGMNYFFQDELVYELNILSWCQGMDSIFKARKGYDIVPYLDRMFIKENSAIDAETAKVRMDYAEVLMQLSEERYFKPVYDWSGDKGLIYGCDNMGRGLDPLTYLDYFRAISWFSAPGNDAPARGSSFRQTKVSSSISHLYERPRTWLEAFHSMGWDANGGVLIKQLDHHLIAGGNLLCMHGLYYSTHGGWWEWAPPCFHFRMPYWPHMKRWLKYGERMCYVLSQGSHVCDIAILYPVETMQAYPQNNAESTLSTAMNLSNHGLDYDFIDFHSIQKSVVENGRMKVADESYKVLLLVDTKAMHQETIDKIKEFAAAGGVVLTMGDVMDETKNFSNYPLGSDDIVSAMRQKIGTPDFVTSKGTGKVLHRHISEYDLYMTMDVEEGDTMTFRATGKPELWDAFHGTFSDIPVVASTETTRSVICPAQGGNSMLVVFSPGDFIVADAAAKPEIEEKKVEIGGDWDAEIIPTMNNKWGDFRLPASDEFIGVEAREMSYDGITSVYGYAPYMRLAVIDSTKNIDGYLPTSGKNMTWEPYLFSWQYGVMDSPGSQGFHGLKAKVDNRFLILDRGAHQIFEGDLFVKEDGKYHVYSLGTIPNRILIDDKSTEPESDIELTGGWHKLTVAYACAPKSSYELKKLSGYTIESRERGMVMIYPEGKTWSEGHDLTDTIVASRWYGTDFVQLGDKIGKEYSYSFTTAPGTKTMKFSVHGKINSVTVDGVPAETQDGKLYTIKNYNTGVSKVEVVGTPDLGFHGAAFFAEPVKMDCQGGVLQAGDWTMAGALKFFSGGVRYGKDVEIEKSSRVILDLGKVDATAEVFLNGKSIDVLLHAPYTLDISDYVNEGTNRLEVLVYSSLSNNYQTIPTPYRGTPCAGLIGPVTITNFK